MSTYTTYGPLAGSTYGFSIAPETGEKAPKTPSGLVVTQAVQTRDGWLGQLIVDKEIVWEGAPCVDGASAVQEANGRVVEVFKHLFQIVDAVKAVEVAQS